MNVEAGWKLFRELNGRFAVLLSLARNCKTANPEDDLMIRAAIVGYSQFSSIENWTHDHYHFVSQRRTADMEPAGLSQDEMIFSCICYGALMAKAFERQITELEFNLCESHLAGYVASLGGKIGVK